MSTEVQAVMKVDSLDGATKRKRDNVHRKSLNIAPSIMNKKHKSDDSRHFKFSKKRFQSFTGGKLFPPYKKRKKEKLIPPTKFLLGGNIRDPLNLNSLQDEEVNRAMNAVTPESSPYPTPQHRKGEVEVIIPADINDPLSLAGGEDNDEAYAASFNTSNPHTPRKVKKKNKKRRSKGSTGGGKDELDPKLEEAKVKTEDIKEGTVVAEVSGTLPEVSDKPKEEEKEEKKDFKRPKLSGSLEKREKKASTDMKDRIVSPVIPQPGAWPGGGRFRKQGQRRSNQATPKFNEKSRKFQYGNYNRYYGYRNLGHHEVDPRLKVFARLQHYFTGRDVLDIGCNTGVVSVAVARDLGARSVVGIDIDKSLISSARQRLRRSSKEFPLCMPVVYGPLDVPGVQKANTFPHNLTFIQGNYVLENDVLVELEQAQFDVILCLSVTKWLHLNWGDDGLKRAFKRMYSQLRPGGVLILEPQDWSSYSRKKTLTETIWRNYQSIKLFPAKFTEYLLSEVGFSKCEVVGAPSHPQKGFQRPIKLFTKGETPLSSRTPRDDDSQPPADEICTPGPASLSPIDNQSMIVSDSCSGEQTSSAVEKSELSLETFKNSSAMETENVTPETRPEPSLVRTDSAHKE